MTPLMISIALWYHARVGDFGRGTGDNNFDSSAVQEALREFERAGLLEPNPDFQKNGGQYYVGTEALRVYVDGLCRVPYPVRKWVLPIVPRLEAAE